MPLERTCEVTDGSQEEQQLAVRRGERAQATAAPGASLRRTRQDRLSNLGLASLGNSEGLLLCL